MNRPPVTFTPRKSVTITVSSTQGVACITSTGLRDEAAPFDDAFDCCLDGIESLLLALYGAGVDLSTSEHHQAVETAIDALLNNLGD